MDTLNYFGPVLRVLPDALFQTSLVNMPVVLFGSQIQTKLLLIESTKRMFWKILLCFTVIEKCKKNKQKHSPSLLKPPFME